MAPLKQKALLLEAKFGNFAVHTVDVPKPGAGEVLIKIQSTALNPLDWKIQKYGIIVKTFPAVLGADIAGDVEEVGKGVSGISVGDRVFFQGRFTKRAGAFQQYAIAKIALFGHIPRNITYDDASTFIVGFTGYVGLFQKAPGGLGLPNILVDGRNKAAGKVIVVLGGSGSVGQYAGQTCRLLHHNYHGFTSPQAISAEVSKLTGDDGVKYVFDAVSISETQQLGYDLLSADGKIALVLSDKIKNKVRGKKIHDVQGDAYLPINHELAVLFYEKFGSLVHEGKIKPEKVEILPNGLAGIPSGLKRMEHNKVSGVKLPQESA